MKKYLKINQKAQVAAWWLAKMPNEVGHVDSCCRQPRAGGGGGGVGGVATLECATVEPGARNKEGKHTQQY